jgi:DNA mismatch repair protein MutS2
VRETIKLLSIENYILSEQQLNEIRKVSLLAGGILRFFQSAQQKYSALSAFTQNIIYEKNVAAEIGKILDDDGNIRSDASPELVRIRRVLNSSVRHLEKTFNAALNKYQKAGFLSEVEETMRNGRRVLGIQSEFKRQLKGIIHDESDTGKTIFIEPEEVVAAQNEIFELEREEKREIHRILKNLTQVISPYKHHFESYQHLLAIMDFTRAKAKYALSINADLPLLEKYPVIYLYNATHPVLSQINKKQNKPVVPLNVELDENKRVLVISGPNAGGKSVAMKTVGLLQIMLQSGLLIPAANQSRIGVFRNIFCDIGDTQSLEDELSTYSSRLMKMKYFLKFSDHQTLVLIDEFGTGTDPVMGGAIAEATLEELNKLKIFGVITTHYSNLKAFAANSIGTFNGSMLFKEAELQPAYILETGKPGSSYAFEIASKSQLPPQIIEHAKKLVSKEHIRFEELLKNVRIEKEHIRLRDKEVTKKEEDVKRKEIDLRNAIERANEKEQRYNLKKLERDDEAIRKMESEFKQMINELKQSSQTNEDEPVKEKIRRFINERKKSVFRERKNHYVISGPKFKRAEIKIGGPVKLIAGSEIGILESIHKNRATIIFNNLKTTLPLDEIIGVATTEVQKIVNTSVKVEVDKEEIPAELDLRGKSKEEALIELDSYLDRALLRNMFQIRILHGKGTGALRDAVHQTLKSHPAIKKFEIAPKDSGGDGVTTVEF